jgi:propionate CoA-transferase
MVTIITPAEAAALIPDGATLGISGMGLSGWAEEIGVAIEEAYLASGRPHGIKLVHGSAIGNWSNAGTHHLGHEGLVHTWIGAHTGAAPNMARLVEQNKLQAYCIPQGVMVQLFREIAAHRPGLFACTRVRTPAPSSCGSGVADGSPTTRSQNRFRSSSRSRPATSARYRNSSCGSWPRDRHRRL